LVCLIVPLRKEKNSDPKKRKQDKRKEEQNETNKKEEIFLKNFAHIPLCII